LSIYVSEDEYFREYNKVPDVKTSVFSYGVDFTPQEYKIDIPTTSVSIKVIGEKKVGKRN
jgi:hypothetical protein